jgi:hypothetical protein
MPRILNPLENHLDRSVYVDNAVEAALIVMNELLVSVPGAGQRAPTRRTHSHLLRCAHSHSGSHVPCDRCLCRPRACAERVDEEDIRRSLAPARVNVPSGIELPEKDTEKLAFKHLREGGGDDTAEEEEDGACVSLDLASEVMLELYLKGIKSVQDAVVVRWS